jgi:hypothetical protein
LCTYLPNPNICPSLPNTHNNQETTLFGYERSLSNNSGQELSNTSYIMQYIQDLILQTLLRTYGHPNPKSRHSCREFRDCFCLTLTCFLLYLGQSWIFLVPPLILNFCSTQVRDGTLSQFADAPQQVRNKYEPLNMYDGLLAPIRFQYSRICATLSREIWIVLRGH